MAIFLSRFWYLKAAILCLALLVSCKQEPAKQEAAQVEKAPSPKGPVTISLTKKEMELGGVILGEPEQRSIQGNLKVNGLLDVPPEQVIAVTAPLGGVVVNTTLLQGQHVHAGDVLATIRNPAFITLQQDYLETHSKLGFAKQELERQQDLVKDQVAPIKNLQRAQSEFALLNAQAQGLAARLRMAGLPVGKAELVSEAKIIAPKTAFVRDVHATVGQSLAPADALCTLVDPSHLHVELTVFEKDVPSLYKGQPIRFTLPNEQGQARMAHIYLIGQTIDPTQRTVRVHGHLDKDDMRGLLPGMYVRAEIETSNQTATTLPEAAIVEFEGKSYVFLRTGKKADASLFEQVEVKPGAHTSGFVQVELPEKVAKGKYVVAGAYSLLSKLKNVKEE
jgi:cobalt-zinc-cadmium efflux system membrane fusion protein